MHKQITAWLIRLYDFYYALVVKALANHAVISMYASSLYARYWSY